MSKILSANELRNWLGHQGCHDIPPIKSCERMLRNSVLHDLFFKIVKGFPTVDPVVFYGTLVMSGKISLDDVPKEVKSKLGLNSMSSGMIDGSLALQQLSAEATLRSHKDGLVQCEELLESSARKLKGLTAKVKEKQFCCVFIDNLKKDLQSLKDDFEANLLPSVEKHKDFENESRKLVDRLTNECLKEINSKENHHTSMFHESENLENSSDILSKLAKLKYLLRDITQRNEKLKADVFILSADLKKSLHQFAEPKLENIVSSRLNEIQMSAGLSEGKHFLSEIRNTTDMQLLQKNEQTLKDMRDFPKNLEVSRNKVVSLAKDLSQFQENLSEKRKSALQNFRLSTSKDTSLIVLSTLGTESLHSWCKQLIVDGISFDGGDRLSLPTNEKAIAMFLKISQDLVALATKHNSVVANQPLAVVHLPKRPVVDASEKTWLQHLGVAVEQGEQLQAFTKDLQLAVNNWWRTPAFGTVPNFPPPTRSSFSIVGDADADCQIDAKSLDEARRHIKLVQSLVLRSNTAVTH